MFCFGTIPSDLIRLTMVLPLGRNAWLDLLGEGVTILIDENKNTIDKSAIDNYNRIIKAVKLCLILNYAMPYLSMVASHIHIVTFALG